MAAVHSAGTNVVSNGTIYMITDEGERRPYTSAGAYLSYGFNSWAVVKQASAEDMALREGAFIPPRDGKIVCSDRGTDKGTCYLITGGKKAAFVSESVFKALGFSFGKALYGDVSFLPADTDISTPQEQHRSGVLINNNGTILLVSGAGLMGIPSMEVLSTWGYSVQDAVPANSFDSQLSQASVVSKREGAKLSPSSDSSPKVSGSSLYQAYIDTYPNLPTNTISSAEDGAQVIELVKKVATIPSSDYTACYPYLTAQSIEMLNKLPELKKNLESAMVQLAGMTDFATKIEVFEGATQALYTQTQIQFQTSYKNEIYWVAKKEASVWKWDLIGTFKIYENKFTERNPNNDYTNGSGKDDIVVQDVFFTEDRFVNDPNTWVFVRIKNNGQSVIKKFDLLVYFNNIVVVNEYANYEIQPTQELVLAIPISYYWTIPDVRKTAGVYVVDVRLGLGNKTNETDVVNNKHNKSVQFLEKPIPFMTNLLN